MSKYTKYKLYQKYETRGSQEAIPVYPNTFSIDGDGTMPLVIVEENSRDCGYTGDTQPIYRWYNMPIDKYYVCDACSSGYENQYLTLVARGSGAFNISRYDTTQYQYSKDNGVTWTDATIQTNISVSNGDRVMFKGTITPAYYYGVGAFSASTQFEAEGNPMSLLYGDNFIGQTSLSGKIYAFKTMFSSCTGLTSIDNLVLPATTLSMCCYEDMFFGCTSLTSIPSGLLPATELVRECYYSMFRGCTSLSSVPSNLLPSTTLAYYCYSRMFSGCTSLTTAPELIAPTLFEHCYDNMFYGCSRLNYVKCLATNISATDCTLNWLYNVSSSGTFVKNSSMSGWPSGVDGIPTNWTVQNA